MHLVHVVALQVFSTVFIIGIQVVAVVLTYEVSDSRLSGDAIDYLVLSSLALMVLTWLLMFIGQIWAEDEMEESKVDDLQEVRKLAKVWTMQQPLHDVLPD